VQQGRKNKLSTQQVASNETQIRLRRKQKNDEATVQNLSFKIDATCIAWNIARCISSVSGFAVVAGCDLAICDKISLFCITCLI